MLLSGTMLLPGRFSIYSRGQEAVKELVHLNMRDFQLHPRLSNKVCPALPCPLKNQAWGKEGCSRTERGTFWVFVKELDPDLS